VATGSVLLPIQAAVLPDGSASNAAPALQRVKSSAADPTPYFFQAAFDASTIESMYWSLRMPADYVSAPVLKIQYKMASAASGAVVVQVRVAAVSDGDAQDVDAKALAAGNNSSGITVPGTAGHMDEISVTLTNADSVAAGDFVVVRLARSASDAGDTATGDMEVIAVTLEYQT
jgi:hypothetical protein